MADKQPFNIGILLYEGFDSLDVTGPHQVFYLMQNAFTQPGSYGLYLIGPDKTVKSYEGLEWNIQLTYKDQLKQMAAYEKDKTKNPPPLALDMIFVPGGSGDALDPMLTQPQTDFYRYLAIQAKNAQMITSVCTGALILARAGLLEGYNCTTHWAFKNILGLYPYTIVAPDYPRYVVDRNRVTGGGISSGIDEAFAIVEILEGVETAKKIQLGIQYAPNPPVNSGDPSRASAGTLQTVSSMFVDTDLYNKIKKGL